MTVGIYVNFAKDINASNTKKFIDFLRKNNIEYFVCDEASDYINENLLPLKKLVDKSDILIVFGGDGTMLKVVNIASEKEKSVLGVNMGKVGFLTDATISDFDEIIKIIKNGFKTSNRVLLEASVSNEVFRAVNEIIISRSDFNVVELEVYIDGYLSDKIVADGVIIATPTGSTAYSLSAGGPVLSPENNAFLITPVCAHNLKSRPMVIADNHEITVKLVGKNKNAALVVDGIKVKDLINENTVMVKKSSIKAKFIIFGKENFYQKLLKKL